MENGARKQQMADRSKYKRAVKGDIAYNMMRMWQGAVGVAPVDGLISPAYVVARHTNSNRMPCAGFISERWPTPNRNTRPAYVGIHKHAMNLTWVGPSSFQTSR